MDRYARVAGLEVPLKVRRMRRLRYGAYWVWYVDAVPMWHGVEYSYRHGCTFQLDPNSGALLSLTVVRPPVAPHSLAPKSSRRDAGAVMAAALIGAYGVPALVSVRGPELAIWRTDSSCEHDWRDSACKLRAERNLGSLTYNSAYVVFDRDSPPTRARAVYEAFVDAVTGKPIAGTRFGKEGSLPALDWRSINATLGGFVLNGKFIAVPRAAATPTTTSLPAKGRGLRVVLLAGDRVYVDAEYWPKIGLLSLPHATGDQAAKPSPALRAALDRAARGSNRH